MCSLKRKKFVKTIDLQLYPLKIKYLEINVMREGKDLHREHYKTLLNEEDTKKWKDASCSRVKRITIRMAMLSKAMYNGQCSSENNNKNHLYFFKEMKPILLKFIRTHT